MDKLIYYTFEFVADCFPVIVIFTLCGAAYLIS